MTSKGEWGKEEGEIRRRKKKVGEVTSLLRKDREENLNED